MNHREIQLPFKMLNISLQATLARTARMTTQSSSDAANLLAALRRRGLSLAAEASQIRVSRRGLLTPGLRDAIAAHRSEILTLLSAEDPEVAWRLAAMKLQVPPHGPILLLVAREGPFVTGTCLSCGDALAPDQLYRCPPCIQAAVLALQGWRPIAPEAGSR